MQQPPGDWSSGSGCRSLAPSLLGACTCCALPPPTVTLPSTLQSTLQSTGACPPIAPARLHLCLHLHRSTTWDQSPLPIVLPPPPSPITHSPTLTHPFAAATRTDASSPTPPPAHHQHQHRRHHRHHHHHHHCHRLHRLYLHLLHLLQHAALPFTVAPPSTPVQNKSSHALSLAHLPPPSQLTHPSYSQTPPQLTVSNYRSARRLHEREKKMNHLDPHRLP